MTNYKLISQSDFAEMNGQSRSRINHLIGFGRLDTEEIAGRTFVKLTPKSIENGKRRKDKE
jgi:hypothetical protein